MRNRRQIPEERKQLYAIGQIVTGAGLLLFLSNFIILPLQAFRPSFDPFQENPMVGMGIRAVGGMLLMIIGGGMKNVAARGVAGSGLVLDPERAREDLQPWAKAAGGLVKDALEEIPQASDQTADGEQGTIVKVRCPRCRTLNDEDARFCKQCGTSL